MPRTAAACALIAWLLLAHPWLQAPPSALGADECWVLDRRRYRYCFRTARCRRACAEDRFADGRCKHGFPYLVPLCECLRPRCAAAAEGATSHAALGSVPE
ncbi:hypothetical protein GQ55_3G234400 [Panicum hallii var. hallii]|uniref:Knottin scorpion toxin-like domain-containing protein n=1 Tax=Panicum hallii var. hallii TaxID=1504633 RepID=A0A2T7ECK2_9POAL|nr:hypothetical protein GQ55_3G234400 [Panicum hallii var. hallii]